MTNKKHAYFLYQSVHTFITRGLLIPITISIGIIVSRYLGPEGKGIIAILSAPVTFICAFGEFGIKQATGYLIAKGDYNAKDIQASMLALFYPIGILAFVTVIFIYAFLGTFKYGWSINLLFAFTVPVILLRRYANGLLLGRQMIAGMNYTELVNTGVILLGILVLVLWRKHGLIGAGLSYLAGPVFSAALVIYWISRFASLMPRWVSPIPMQLIHKGILYATSLFVVTFNSRISLLMLGKMQGESVTGIYSVGNAICELLWQIPLSIGVVLFARSISWNSELAKDRFKQVLLLLRIMFPFSIFSAGLLFLASYFLLPVVYGVEFSDSIFVLIWLLPGTVPYTLFLFMHFYAAGQGRPQIAFYGFIPAILISIFLNLFLIPRYGIHGAAISSTTSYLIGSTIYFFFFRSLYPCSIKELIFTRRKDFIYLWKMMIGKT